MADTITLPKVLRTVSAYVVEWGYCYPSGLYGDDHANLFTFLPGAFNASLARGHNLILSQDMNGQPFAQTSDGTLTITSDDVGLLVTAKLLDSPANRQLCRQIDCGKVRGWSHKFRPVLGGFRTRIGGGVVITDHHRAELEELTIVVRKRPRQLVRSTPVFLSGGPKGVK